MTPSRAPLFAWCVALAAAVACGSPASSGRPVTRQVIGPAGGQASAAAGAIKLLVPAGALKADVAITLQEIDSPLGGNVGQVYDLGPPGTKFALPVKLTLKYRPSDLGGLPPDDLHVATLSRGYWVPVVSSVAPGATTVTGTITHLSPWTVIHFSDVVPPEPDGGTEDAGEPDDGGAGGSGGQGGDAAAGKDGGAPDSAAAGAGAAGTSGAAGTTGVAGRNGAAGTTGAAGTSGGAGTSGAAGAGAAGTSGAAGTGAAGTGASGASGQAGDDGGAPVDDAGADPDADPDA